jgi:TetR/AcrR family transcriptional repressor of nem operon
MSTKTKILPAKDRLIGAAIELILSQGYNATTVDQICQAAELTKGSFFHYFKNKEVLGIAALETWGAYGKTIYAEAWDDDSDRPLEALYRFIEIMTELSMRPEAPCRCVVGTISQEMAQTNEGLRDACSLQLSIWTEMTAQLIKRAKAHSAPNKAFEPDELAWFLNGIWQGSMLIAKTRQNPQIIAQNLEHARRYVSCLFGSY